MGLILPHAPQFSRYESNIAATPSASAPGTTVNHYTSAAHTKHPTPTELIAASSFDATLVMVSFCSNSVSNGDSSTLTDIMIGAASAEAVIIPDLASGWVAAMNAVGGARHYIFPLYIPSGSRISARSQSVRTSGNLNVVIELFGGPRDPAAWWYGQQVTAYGANASNSAGVTFTPGTGDEGSAATVGTTTADHECLVLGVQGDPSDTSWVGYTYHIDVGLGSSSTEWIAQDSYFASDTSSETLGPSGRVWWPIFRPIQSGTELMVRGEGSSGGDAISAIIYGVS